MKRLLLIFIALLPCAAHAQIFSYDSTNTEYALRTMSDIAASVIADTFSPMTHYNKGDMRISGSPAYVTINRVTDKIDIKAKNLSGYSGAAGFGYAVTDDIIAYSVINGIKISGNTEYDPYGSLGSPVKSKVSYALTSFLAGGGYQIFKNEYVSIPAYIGFNIQYLSANFTTDVTQWNILSQKWYTGIQTKGNNMLYGCSGGISASFKLFTIFHISPYFLFMQNFNGAKMDAEITVNRSNGTEILHNPFSVRALSSSMAGLNFGLIQSRGFSFAVSVGGLLSSAAGFGNTALDDGAKFKTAAFAASYTR